MKKRWRYIEKDFHKVFKKKCNEMRLHLPLWLINIIAALSYWDLFCKKSSPCVYKKSDL